MRKVVLIATVMGLLTVRAVWGFIDPKHTPADLVKESQAIVIGTLAADADGASRRLKVSASLKGSAGQEVLIRLAAGPGGGGAAAATEGAGGAESGAVRHLHAQDAPVAILFVSADGKQAYLHLAGEWVQLMPVPGGGWQVDAGAKAKNGIWAGGTDMLIRLTRQLLADPQATVPVGVGMTWMRDRAVLGHVDGVIAGLQAVELGSPPRPHVYVASDKGDRLFAAKPNDEAFADVTQALGLDSRARRFVWMDIDGVGTPELVTWDGAAVQVRQWKDGKFARVGEDYPLAGECLGLAACQTQPGGAAAVLVTTGDWPFLLARDAKGRWSKNPLPGEARQAGPATCACLVLDVDNDGYVDILQPRAKGGLLWRGTAQGFAAPVGSAVTCPEGPGQTCLGDFKGDASMDVFLSGPKQNELWENDGKGHFTPVLAAAGSLSYKCPPGAAACLAVDLNHDGRTDLCLLYPNAEFSYHFNRGCRCFGEEGELRLTGPDGAPVAAGQVAAAVEDFNGDGLLDLAVAFTDGQVVCYYNDAYNRPLLRVGLKAPLHGPLAFSVWQGDKHPFCIGTFMATAMGVPVPLRTAGDCLIRYALPGKGAVESKVAWPAKMEDPRGLKVVLEP